MSTVKIAVISFPGNNCEVETMRCIREAGMQPVFFRWNDDLERLSDIDGYFLPGGFSYEDRGRAGMVAGRDPIFTHLRKEAAVGKVIVGNCNGAQVLVESGLIPNAKGLEMSLAQNIVDGTPTGFLSKWVYITRACAKDRCAVSGFDGVMHVPIAHGEGRFTTKDRTLWETLMDNDQLAFVYCDAEGNNAPSSNYNPNGSEMAAAGICNPEGNVVALMPHPERTPKGMPYFESMRKWIEGKGSGVQEIRSSGNQNIEVVSLPIRSSSDTEIFIDTIIVNNEERTVEQTAKRLLPQISLKQLKYIAVTDGAEREVLSDLLKFNPNKEVAYLRRGESFTKWDPDSKEEVDHASLLDAGTALVRTDEYSPNTGVCYVCGNVEEKDLLRSDVLEIFGNPHASTLERL